MSDIKLPLHRNKVNKSELLLSILNEVPADRNNRDDRKKIKLIAEKRLEQYPPEQRKGSKITIHDLKNAFNDRDRKQNNGVVPKQVQSKPKKLAKTETVDQLTEKELLAGRDFFRTCDYSLVKANNILRIVTLLWNKE